MSDPNASGTDGLAHGRAATGVALAAATHGGEGGAVVSPTGQNPPSDGAVGDAVGSRGAGPATAAVDVRAARSALDTVTRSATARATFVAAYDGPGEAVGVLRQYLARVDDPAARDADRARMTELARTAFARPDSKADRRRADEALAVFHREDATRAAQLTGLARALAALRASDADPPAP